MEPGAKVFLSMGNEGGDKDTAAVSCAFREAEKYLLESKIATIKDWGSLLAFTAKQNKIFWEAELKERAKKGWKIIYRCANNILPENELLDTLEKDDEDL
jgi:hypothetical protein